MKDEPVSDERLELMIACERDDSEISRRNVAIYKELLASRKRIAELQGDVAAAGRAALEEALDIVSGLPQSCDEIENAIRALLDRPSPPATDWRALCEKLVRGVGYIRTGAVFEACKELNEALVAAREAGIGGDRD